MHAPNEIDSSFFSWATIIGALIGFGRLLDSGEKISFRAVLGRAIVSSALAAMAPVILIWLPSIPRTAEFALAAALASLGTSGLQLALHWIVLGRNR